MKLEYCDGEIYAMAGGTPAHADLAASITHLLVAAPGGRCRVSSSDLKVRVEATDLSTFPDVTVVCGERLVSPIDKNAVINPTIVVEVTSDSTEDYDRGEKLNHLHQCPSLRMVLFVSHRSSRITSVTRTTSGWGIQDYGPAEHVPLEEWDARLSVDEIYAGIQLDG